MKHYVLLGAGFSHNWGGWLASEAFEFLLGDSAVVDSPRLRTLLWKHRRRGGFESALDELQRGTDGHTRDEELQLLSAIQRMFQMMNFAFRSKGLEFGRQPFDYPVRNFLLRFDGIFSLNQDLLLEYCYRGSKDGLVDRTDVRTERDWEFPGMRLASTSSDAEVFPSAARTWVPDDTQRMPEGVQPIFKLHGSANWRTAEGSDIMILGGGKQQAIDRFPVLRWYSGIFSECLSSSEARLMVVGYGFRDDHINETLVRAIERGLRLFIVDPLGADVVSSLNPLKPGELGYQATAIEEAAQKALVGASRRPLSSTFSTDEVERRKLDRFFW